VSTLTKLRKFEILITIILYLERNTERRDLSECSARMMAISYFLSHSKEIGASRVVSPFSNKFQSKKKR